MIKEQTWTETLREICDKFSIKKRRTSGYYSEGNGFAERNVRTIRELFRSLLLDFEVPQNQWNEILPGIIFALNISISCATKCTPYEVLYGRRAILPIDIILGTNSNSVNAGTPQEYLKDFRIQLRDILLKVNDNLKISQQRMIEQYNRNVMFYDYRPNDTVWLKTEIFQTRGEQEAVAPKIRSLDDCKKITKWSKFRNI